MHVFAVVFAERHVVGNYVGNGHHILFELRLNLALARLNRGYAVVIFLYLFLNLFRLFLFSLLHQSAYALRKRIALCAPLVALALERAFFAVERKHFVDERKFFILELLFYILSYEVGIFPYEVDVYHGKILLQTCCKFAV